MSRYRYLPLLLYYFLYAYLASIIESNIVRVLLSLPCTPPYSLPDFLFVTWEEKRKKKEEKKIQVEKKKKRKVLGGILQYQLISWLFHNLRNQKDFNKPWSSTATQKVSWLSQTQTKVTCEWSNQISNLFKLSYHQYCAYLLRNFQAIDRQTQNLYVKCCSGWFDVQQVLVSYHLLLLSISTIS